MPLVPAGFAELERLAETVLSTRQFTYIAGGAGAEVTMRSNREALDRVTIHPRMMTDVSTLDLSCKLFGNSLPYPIFTCPIGVLELAHPKADLAVAEAASRLGVPMVFSNQASYSMEECAGLMGDTPRWFQLYWSSCDELVVSFLRRAEGCGCRAIVATLDTTMLGWRPRDLDLAHLPFLEGQGLAQYIHDPVFQSLLDDPTLMQQRSAVTASSLALLARLCRRYPGSFWNNLKTRRPLAAVRKFIDIYTRADLSWDNLPFLRNHTSLPIVLKGILHPDDARRALDQGVDAVYVSNHGGRQIDGAVSSIEALKQIVKVVDGRVPVLFDSGIRGGADIYKALALGASAVGIGRPYAYALALAGCDGVTELLSNYLCELKLSMSLSGVTGLAQLNKDCLL